VYPALNRLDAGLRFVPRFFQVELYVVHRMKAQCRVPAQATLHNAFDFFRRMRRKLRYGLGLLPQNCGHGRHSGVTSEGTFSSEHLVSQTAEAEDITSRI
jgi:hypothetical protein